MTSSPGYAAPAAKTAREAAVHGPGARLDPDLQRFEGELGVNLAGARIHTGPAAERTVALRTLPNGQPEPEGFIRIESAPNGQILRRRYYPVADRHGFRGRAALR